MSKLRERFIASISKNTNPQMFNPFHTEISNYMNKDIQKDIQKDIKINTSIETAINKLTKGTHWDELYNDIIDNPSKDGKYKKIFCNGIWDLKRFEEYMVHTLPLINLSNVLAYKYRRLLSEKKGYLNMEQSRKGL